MPTQNDSARHDASPTADALEPADAHERLAPREKAVLIAAALADVQDGMSMRQAATKHGLNEWQVRRAVHRWDATDYQAVVRNLLVAKGQQAVEDWASASREAATRGKHEPARDLLTHAGIVEPVGQQTTRGANIAIVIGEPGKPVTLTHSND